MHHFSCHFTEQFRAPAVHRLRRWLLLGSAFAVAAVLWQEPARAQSGTWTAVSGSWSTGTNWSGSTVASGTGNTAFFRSTGTTTLDTSRTIGTISSGSGLRVIQGSGVTLTLATSSGIPTLTGTVGSGTLGISAAIAGTQGFQKTGTSTLVLGGTNPGGTNTFSGTALLQSGTTIISNIDALRAVAIRRMRPSVVAVPFGSWPATSRWLVPSRSPAPPNCFPTAPRPSRLPAA
jgi:hypothetical protein